MANPLEGFNAIVYKEIKQLRRDRGTVIMAIMILLFQLIIFGYAINLNVENIKMVIYDLDRRQASRDLIRSFENTHYFTIVQYVSTDRELNDAIITGRAKVGLKIPDDYSSRLFNRQPTQVAVIIDGSDPTAASQALNYSNLLGLRESLRRSGVSFETVLVDMRPTLLFNPQQLSPNFLVPGLIAVVLLFVTTFLTAFSVVREQEAGTLEQIFVTPIRPLGFMLGKIVPMLGLGMIELLLIVAFMRLGFRIPIHGNVLLLFALAPLYLFASLGLGLLISTKARNQIQAVQMAIFVMLPSIFFSGYIFSRDSMPLIFYLASFMVPATYFIEILRGIILRGAGLADLWPNVVMLALLGLGLLLSSAFVFQKRLSQD